jgi:hypothetical protein
MGESLDMDQLRAAARQGRLEWQRHALERMVERGITRAEVREFSPVGKASKTTLETGRYRAVCF